METLEMYERLRAGPFLKWAGGKTQLLKELSRHALTRFSTYHEPFIGGGAFFFFLHARGKIRRAIISDSNPDLINAFIAVRDRLNPLLLTLADLQRNARDEGYYYNVARRRFNEIRLGNAMEEDLQKAALLLYLNKTCFNGLYRVNKKGEFNVPWGGYKNPKIFDERNLRAVSAADIPYIQTPRAI